MRLICKMTAAKEEVFTKRFDAEASIYRNKFTLNYISTFIKLINISNNI